MWQNVTQLHIFLHFCDKVHDSNICVTKCKNKTDTNFQLWRNVTKWPTFERINLWIIPKTRQGGSCFLHEGVCLFEKRKKKKRKGKKFLKHCQMKQFFQTLFFAKFSCKRVNHLLAEIVAAWRKWQRCSVLQCPPKVCMMQSWQLNHQFVT